MFEHRDVIKMYKEKQRKKRFKIAVLVNLAIILILTILFYGKV